MKDIDIKYVYKQYADMNVDEFRVGEFDRWNGQNRVDFIKYHEPKGDGDCHYCSIVMTNGNVIRIFKPDRIEM